MRYGYARISSESQNLDLQIDALKKADCDKIFTETYKGNTNLRPTLDKLLKLVKPGDYIVVYKLDRFSRSGLIKTLELIDFLASECVYIQSISEGINTGNTSPMGKAFLGLLAVFAELERSIIKERVAAGIEQARNQGKYKGRSRKLTLERYNEMVKRIKEGKTVIEVCELFGVTRSAYYQARSFFRDLE